MYQRFYAKKSENNDNTGPMSTSYNGSLHIVVDPFPTQLVGDAYLKSLVANEFG